MCGIAGIWNLDGRELSRATLAAFTDSLAHRGPDGSGYYTDPGEALGLGHRRLSILDLSDHAAQPMSFDNRLLISFNGEVYNFIELKKELSAKGYAFKTDSDTEVILAAFHCWGTGALEKFNGMWAIALWDRKEKKLLLARDRFGIKPLFYLYIPGKIFAFASETYAFRFLEGFKREVNEMHLALQLSDHSSLEGRGHTLFKNIFQLLPGHLLELKKNEAPLQKRWWSIKDHVHATALPYEKQVEEFSRLFADSLRLRLRSDVPVATALSGGLDSSSVYCALHHMMKQHGEAVRITADWQRAFIATFPGSDNDERRFAEQVVKHAGSRAVFIEPDLSGLAGKIRQSAILSDSVTPTPVLSAAMIYEGMRREGVKVSLDGHGVDEMMYGYNWLVRSVFRDYAGRGDGEHAGDILQTYLNMFDDSARVAAEAELNKLAGGKQGAGGIGAYVPAALKNLLKNVFSKSTVDLSGHEWLSASKIQRPAELSDKPYHFSSSEYPEYLLFDTFFVSTLPGILRNFDRASMQHGVEVRMPFMDWRLVSFVFSLPQESKLGHGFTKRILRDAMKDILPEPIRTRKLKIGLNLPLADWFSTELKQFVLDEVHSEKFRQSTVWRGSAIADFVEKKMQENNWTSAECSRVWQYLNAHLITTN